MLESELKDDCDVKGREAPDRLVMTVVLGVEDSWIAEIVGRDISARKLTREQFCDRRCPTRLTPHKRGSEQTG